MSNKRLFDNWPDRYDDWFTTPIGKLVKEYEGAVINEFLQPAVGEKILDACAGLGGKTGHIAQLMENKGIIIAADVENKKLESLQLDSKRLGIDIIETKPLNLLKTSIKDFDFYFDRVLIVNFGPIELV